MLPRFSLATVPIRFSLSDKLIGGYIVPALGKPISMISPGKTGNAAVSQFLREIGFPNEYCTFPNHSYACSRR